MVVPSKSEAIAALCGRVPDAAGAVVQAVTPLSRHTIYDRLRLKRSELRKAPNREEKKHLDELLNEALEQTFSCCDPIDDRELEAGRLGALGIAHQILGTVLLLHHFSRG